MKEYDVRVERVGNIYVTVEAETEEEAIDKAYVQAEEVVMSDWATYGFTSAEVEDECDIE